MKNQETKICLICNTEFSRPKGGGIKLWEKRILCSIPCRTIYMRKNEFGFKKGHGHFNGAEKGWFEKGSSPWNKDTHFQSNDALIGWVKKNGAHNRGKKASSETIEKIKLARSLQVSIPSGEDHWNWRGGTTPFRIKLMHTALYRKWRTAVFVRDNYTCQDCFKGGGIKLNADHIKAYSMIAYENNIQTIEDAKNCAALWDVSNGRTLCEPCHWKTDTFGSKSIIKGKGK